MTKPHLYVNPDGWEVTRHSYSGSQTFRYCAKLYQLERIAGWHAKEERAAQFFGSCIETAVRLAHTASDLSMGADFFQDEWTRYKTADIAYAKTEGDWASLLLSGREMMRLYAIFYPNTGFGDAPEFPVKLSKNIDGIDLYAYLDMIVTRSTGTKVVLDCKVSGASIPKMVALDPQLRTYAAISGIPDVGFLWFEKNGRTLKVGDEVILLSGQHKGELAYIASTESDDVFEPTLRVVTNPAILEDVEKQFKGKRKAEDVAAKAKAITENSFVVSAADVTKQRIYMDTATISEASQQDIMRQMERDIRDIRRCDEEDFWPMESGVRFPNDKCPSCVMRGICSGNDKLRDELVTRGKTLDKKGYDIEWGD